MRIKSNYVMQHIADEFIVVPIAEEADRLHGVIKLNESGALLWNLLAERECSIEEMESALMREYNIPKSLAHSDVDYFINLLLPTGCFRG